MTNATHLNVTFTLVLVAVMSFVTHILSQFWEIQNWL
jgi:hypothetical protein